VTETSPEGALSRLEAKAFDCVISDYNMPRMDGLELFEAIRGYNVTGPRCRHAFDPLGQTPCMKMRFDRETCIGMFQCTAEWDAFEKDENEGKADLAESEEVEPDIFEREIPSDAELDAKFAARVCPVDAIEVYDDDGEQIV